MSILAIFLAALIFLPSIFLIIVPMWKIYNKAGKPGWASIIPIYNIIVWLQIIKKPVWWLFMLIIPGVNLVFSIIMIHKLSQAFGHGGGFTVGLIFLPIIFIPILGYGGDRYLLDNEAC